MPALDEILQAQLQQRKDQQLYRQLVPTEILPDGYIRRNGKTYLNFSSNDYFGLSQHPDVIAAARDALSISGAGASALVTGYHPYLETLAANLAKAKNTEAALIFGSGYLANIGTISALVGKGDLILADKLCHACMVDGAQLSGATFRRFRHNDMEHLGQLLAERKQYRHCLILTETVFSMDGDCAPLAAIQKLAQRHDAWLMSDDAHGLGITDSSFPRKRESGANALKDSRLRGDDDVIQMGTLSKGLGAYGGYVCGSQTLVDYLVNTARSAIFTTALPPSIVAAADKALSILMSDTELGRAPLNHARHFTSLLGLPEAQSPIVPLVLGEAEQAIAASKQLAEEGFWVSAIRPPTVPASTSRLRFSFSALHKTVDIKRLVTAIRKNID